MVYFVFYLLFSVRYSEQSNLIVDKSVVEVGMMRKVAKIARCPSIRSISKCAAMSTQKDANIPRVQNFINGQFVESVTTKWIPLYNPGRFFELTHTNKFLTI